METSIDFFLRILFTQERRYENKSGCFVTGFDVTSKVPTILSTLFFRLCNIQVPSQSDFVIKLKFRNQWSKKLSEILESCYKLLV